MRRAAVRVLVGGAIVALAVAAVGLVGARLRFGATLNEARQQIEREVRAQFTDLSARLETAATTTAADPALIPAVQTREANGIRQLFDRTARAEQAIQLSGVAVTVYGPEARPIAWAGRPATVPVVRIMGPRALFLAPSPLGLRLVRVEPVVEAERRVATVVAEAVLPQSPTARGSGGGAVLPTSIVPVPVRPQFEGAADATEQSIIIRLPTGEAIAAIDVSAEDVDAARARWRRQILAAELLVGCVVLLLLAGPLLDARRVVPSVSTHVGLTIIILALLAAARVVAWNAVRLADLDRPALGPRAGTGVLWIALASPLDFLATALWLGAVVALAASSFIQWRQSRRARVRVVSRDRPLESAAFVTLQVAAGAVLGVLVVGYELFVRSHLSESPVDLLHFSLHPWDGARLSLVFGLVVLHAALAALAILLLEVARAGWVVGREWRWARAWIPALWAIPAVLVLLAGTDDWERRPLVPTLLIIGFIVAAAWRVRRYRAMLAHASQAARLAMFFVALALPSIAFYPSLLDAAARARHQLIEARYAPEVMNQRRNLLLQLNEALAQVDRVADLPDLVLAGEPVQVGAPSPDAAFHVWSQTVLSERRLTSSVELYDAAGALVSRFALKLPDSAPGQPWQEAACTWEVFEEISPFFAEERHLLHASRGICVPTSSGDTVIVGSIVLHANLDYSNLSFISAQSPYVALLRAQDARLPERTPRERVEFTVYGWSRRPLYISGPDAWPLPEPVFGRIFASRDPVWTELERGNTSYEVYFLNDRAGIYALGYPRTGAVGHLISLAELVVVSALLMILLLVGGAMYGLIATRTPTSTRALLREVRASFYRKLFIAFVAAAVVPVLTLAFVTRAYIAVLINADVEVEATRTAESASRVVEDVGTIEARGGSNLQVVDDNLVVWLSRVIAQDVNVFDGPDLLASSERNLFASGLLSTRTPGDVYRAIVLEGRHAYLGRETVAGYPYLIAAAPVRVQNRDAILTVPLTSRQQDIELQTDELDRRVLLAAVLFILLGAGIGYWMAERIADPVNRLMKATGRIARGDLDARILATSSDEFRRLVEAFNRMAADLQRQRVELERTNRLAAWADMARQVAHDIKNPLTPIQLNAEHLRRVHIDRDEPLGSVLDECVDNILTQVRLLRQLASEFSSFASSPTPRPAPTALDDLVADVVAPYRTGLAGQVRIDSEVPRNLPKLMVDKTLLSRALTNIIENAIHAMPSGGTLRLAATAADHQVRLSVSDTGVGMDQDALARIFEPYFSTRAAGTGLGLTIAKRNVELNNGSIDVQSERGKGTTVTLTLPAVE